MTTFQEIAGSDATTSRYRLLVCLRDEGPIGRAQLARLTGLAASTVTSIVQGLITEGIVVEANDALPQVPARPGPRSKPLVVNPRLGTFAGIDFGFRTVRILITDVSGRELAFDSVSLSEGYDAITGLGAARDLLLTMLERGNLATPTVAGLALPGPVDTLRQVVIGSAILPGWADCSAQQMGEALGLNIVVENDANLAALGEHLFGAGRLVDNTITVKFHSGVGAGIILNDVLVSGWRGGAGEIGHIEIDPRGPLCRCGKRGCLDTFVAVPAILAALLPHREVHTVGQLMALLDARDAGAEQVVWDAASLVGRALATASLIVAPDRVILVGSMARAGRSVLDPITAELERHMVPETHAAPSVVLGELGTRHTAMGAVALALRTEGWLE